MLRGETQSGKKGRNIQMAMFNFKALVLREIFKNNPGGSNEAGRAWLLTNGFGGRTLKFSTPPLLGRKNWENEGEMPGRKSNS